jgi:alkylation response protein AidB-like acyl-CoA dehydrogenase
MASALRLPPAEGSADLDDLRREVRAFLAEASFTPRCDAWLSGHDPEFSRRLGACGWLGMTFPERYGGHGRRAVERYAVIEELLAAGAPVAAHWVADRQTGPLLLRYGTEDQRQRLLPGIARGEIYCCIGMSEPDAGSDLAAIRTRAERVDGGWRLNGAKIWTSHAHRSHYMLTLVRSSPPDEQDRHAGMSQVLVDLTAPGVNVRPIRLLTGEPHFNEVVFEGALVPDELVVGEVGNGWEQVTSELAYERSGPERLLSTFPLLVQAVREIGPHPDPHQAAAIGRALGHLAALRQLSASVAAALDRGESPGLQAALVKDVGTRHERAIIDLVRRAVPVAPALSGAGPQAARLAEAVLGAPGFTLRGGTNEILRGIVARGLGLRSEGSSR